jgi:stage V sporulation protein B
MPENTKKEKRSDFLVQGSILAAASIIVRLIGLVYRIPMANILGEEGQGLYSIAYDIYSLALILSSYSLPLSVSKMIAAKNINKEYKNAMKIFKCAMLFAVTAGGVMALFMFLFADLLAGLYGSPNAAYPLRILAPTIFVVAILGVLRGFFQGKNNMLPTAVSQIMEQIVNAAVSVGAAYFMMKRHSASVNIAGYGAAGGTMGTLSGALTAMLVLLVLFFVCYPYERKRCRNDNTGKADDTKRVFKVLLMTILPVILSQVVYQSSSIVDKFIYSQITMAQGVVNTVREAQFGMYSYYTLLVSVPLGISTAMSSSILPSITASCAKGDYETVKLKVHDSIKLNMLIAIPCSIGIFALASPIIKMLFPSTGAMTARITMVGALAVIFYALSTITSAVLQSINQMRLPVIHSAAAIVVQAVLLVILTAFTPLGIYSLAVCNVVFPLIVCVLNWISVSRHLKYDQEVKRTFVLPFLVSLVMGVVAFLVYRLFYFVLRSNMISCIVAVLAAVLVYFVLLIKVRALTKEELYNMPMGGRLVTVARKMKLME